jgi:hypothetical protein
MVNLRIKEFRNVGINLNPVNHFNLIKIKVQTKNNVTKQPQSKLFKHSNYSNFLTSNFYLLTSITSNFINYQPI